MPPKIHGHRAARGRRPENTLPAVEYALRHGVDGVEVDLCVSADDQIVVHHDLCLNPDTTRDAKGKWVEEGIPIRSLTLSEIRQYDVGRLKPDSEYAEKFPEQIPVDGARVPALKEFLEWMQKPANADVILNLELKENRKGENTPTAPRKHFVDLLKREIKLCQLPPERISLQSFDRELMRLTKQLWPELKTGFTTYNHADLQKAKDQGADVFSCNHADLTEPLVQKAHDLGLEVYAWTVNEERDIVQVAGWGVDVITTDYPERCRALLYGSG